MLVAVQDRYRVAAGTVVLTAAMLFSMLPLFLVGALAPDLVREFGIGKPLLGGLVTVSFAAAALTSPVMGRVVDRVGPRRCLLLLFAVSAATLAGFAIAPVYFVLAAAIGLGGIPQALANPVTNKIIAEVIPVAQRGMVVGLKQSGVQLGAFAAGLPLAALASWLDWRAAVGAAAGLAVLMTVLLAALPPGPPRPAQPVPARGARPPIAGAVRWLAVFSVLLGAGVSAVNVYVALYATQDLGFSAPVAAAVVAVLGISGIAGRVGWLRVVPAAGPPASTLILLSTGAVAAAGALLAAGRWGTAWIWLGAIGIGACAVAANAVSMLAVLRLSAPQRTGRDSGLVSAGFFAGFAAGPAGFGLMAHQFGYGAGWVLVAAEFAAAAGVAALWRRGL